MKNKLKKLFIILISIILLLNLVGCSSEDKKNELNIKVEEELKYLESEIILLINSLNNITIENYKIKSDEVTLSKSDSKNSSESNPSSSTESSGASKEEKIRITEIVTQNIIGEDRTTNWEKLISKIENLYNVWPTISVDLIELNISQDYINEFNTILNEIAINIKAENKLKSIDNLVRLYENVLNFYNNFDNDLSSNEIKIKSIKYDILTAYKNIEADNFEEASKNIEVAQNKNNEILSKLNDNKFTINKIDIILDQLLSAIELNDKDIFYVSYINLLEEINLIKSI